MTTSTTADQVQSIHEIVRELHRLKKKHALLTGKSGDVAMQIKAVSNALIARVQGEGSDHG